MAFQVVHTSKHFTTGFALQPSFLIRREVFFVKTEIARVSVSLAPKK